MHLYSTGIVCPELPAPENGFIAFSAVSQSLLPYLTIAIYGCNIGYRLLTGDAMRSCVQSRNGGGEWNGTAPVCIGEYIIYVHAYYFVSSSPW